MLGTSKKKALAITAALLFSGGTASAAVITGWNLGNVSVSPTAEGTSTIYDRAATDSAALATGRVTFNGETGFSPGVKVVNDDPLAVSDGKVPNGYNCIMANTAAGVTCNAEKKTHKRLKLQATGSAPIDMVFNVDPNGLFTTAGNDGLYKVFQAFGNDTGSSLEGFRVTLGTGTGTDFTISEATDGLSFVQRTEPFKNNQFSSFFSEGLFGGDADEGLRGYFSDDRTGFNLAFDGLDSFLSTGLFGDYEDLFGKMLSYSNLPKGYYFDADGDASTDDVLIAHQLADGSWSQNRSLAADGTIGYLASGNGGTNYATLQELIAALKAQTGFQECRDATDGQACFAGDIAIDDLAKFNMTFYIDPTGYKDGEFTLRYATSLVPAQVPEPGALALVMLALGALGVTVRRRRQTL